MNTRHAARVGLLLAGCLAALLAPPALAAPSVAAASAAGVAAAALAAAPGRQLTISGLQLEGDSQASSLTLQRLEVWHPASKVVVHAAGGEVARAPPPTRWFTGSLAGAPGSSVVLAVHPDGRMAGAAYRGNATWALTRAPAGPAAAAAAGSGLVARTPQAQAAAEALQRPAGPRCGNTGRMTPPGRTGQAMAAAAAGQAVKVGGGLCVAVLFITCQCMHAWLQQPALRRLQAARPGRSGRP